MSRTQAPSAPHPLSFPIETLPQREHVGTLKTKPPAPRTSLSLGGALAEDFHHLTSEGAS